MADELRLYRVIEPPPMDPPRVAGSVFWFRVEMDNGLTVYVLVDFDDNGKPVIRSLRVDGEDVHTGLIRAIPLGAIQRQLRFSISPDSVGYVGLPSGEEILADGSDISPAALDRQRPGESNKEFYERVAEAYRWWASRSNKPSVEMAEVNNIPVGTVRRWVREARDAKVLEKGSRGRAG